MKRGMVLFTIILTLVALLAACSGAPTASKGPVTVGSKIDTEGALLSQMIILMLRANGFEVNDRSQFGTTPIVRKALISGEIQMYPEYTGNGAFFFNEPDSPAWKDAKAGYERVKKLDESTNGIIWLQPAPANNTWGIAITKALSDKEKIKSLDDLAAYINRGGYIKMIGSDEFVTSPAALPAFQKAYGFIIKQQQMVTISSGNTAQTEKAAAEGTDGINAAMAYGTDGDIAARGLVFLADPRNVQPVYEPAPIVRGEVYQKYPEMGTILNPVFASLDLPALQSLNAKIAVEGRDAAGVAGDYLKSKGFLKEGGTLRY